MNTESFVSPDPERLAGLVFELASQLHIERTQRIALEIALGRSGALDAQVVEGLASDAELHRRSTAELDRSMEKLMRVLTEHADQRRPLRPTDAESSSGGH
jgi:hypothetical protein